MLSLIELERAASVFSDLLVGGRIERWLEPERGRIAFSIYRGGVDDKIKCIVDLDARPGGALRAAHTACHDPHVHRRDQAVGRRRSLGTP